MAKAVAKTVRKGSSKAASGSKAAMGGRQGPHADVLANLGLVGATLPGCHDGHAWSGSGPERVVRTPIDGSVLATVRESSAKEYERAVASLQEAFPAWRAVPAPRRGELVRQWADRLRQAKHPLGRLVSLETGKSLQEGLGEVQEMIDICDYAVGLSRTLGGKTIPSERVHHRMMEQWHPLGIVGVISAFNFPVAVYAWNAAIALVCGDVVLWKPSEKTPLTAIAVQKVLAGLAEEHGHPGIAGLVVGGADPVGKLMAADPRIPLVSATGSTRMGKLVAQAVSARLGRAILELGGNNAIVVSGSADLDLALRAVLFGAVGTAGQRCTTTRRLILHKSIAKEFTKRLVAAYAQVRVGDPLDGGNQMGPLIDEAAVAGCTKAIAQAKKEGGKVLSGGKTLPHLGSCYVQPTLVQAPKGDFPLAQEETFAPILYLFEYDRLEDAIRLHNGVRQGLSSAIFTTDVREAEAFVSATGSDCGIANVNLGTSGAEIGGAFGGEKETGGGRESGSDAWKQYMRRQTNTINYGKDLPLAQGIRFEVWPWGTRVRLTAG
ncbi:MAG TPA: aldehyde dehydrogenase family protein [Candidatus Thermoplasmatota archaeon]|nr:aldehyde dehydrogenase family protein [Candidatus Thermoplasmatota archaeon]